MNINWCSAQGKPGQCSLARAVWTALILQCVFPRTPPSLVNKRDDTRGKKRFYFILPPLLNVMTQVFSVTSKTCFGYLIINLFFFYESFPCITLMTNSHQRIYRQDVKKYSLISSRKLRHREHISLGSQGVSNVT